MEVAGGASQPTDGQMPKGTDDVPCAHPGCRFWAHPQPAEEHWAGYCCGACRLRFLQQPRRRACVHGRRCLQREQQPQPDVGAEQHEPEQEPRPGAGAYQPGEQQSGQKRNAPTDATLEDEAKRARKASPLRVVQCRVHLHTLGLTGAVTLAEVRKAYRALALQHHPDKNVSGDPELATERFKQIGAAYEAICSHHEWLAQPRAP